MTKDQGSVGSNPSPSTMLVERTWLSGLPVEQVMQGSNPADQPNVLAARQDERPLPKREGVSSILAEDATRL